MFYNVYKRVKIEQDYGKSEWATPFEKELKEFKAVEPAPTVDDDDNIPF